MTLYEATQDFLEKIYVKTGPRITRYITSVQLGTQTPKDVYKVIVAMYYVRLLKEFQGTYNSVYSERRFYLTVRFVEEYFNIHFSYDFTNITAKMQEWILINGTWNDKLFWIDTEFWND